MKYRPSLFNGEMVRRILDGSKTQTRRVVKYIPPLGYYEDWCGKTEDADFKYIVGDYRRFCPYGQPGDRLWVRETFALSVNEDGHPININGELCAARDAQLLYRADNIPTFDGVWTPSIHMPRWASRIDLEITAVRVERLQDISEEDARAEGVSHSLGFASGRTARGNFEHLWWTVYGDDSWEQNPWVWVVEFKRIKP